MYTSFSSFIDISTLYKSVNMFFVFGFQLTWSAITTLESTQRFLTCESTLKSTSDSADQSMETVFVCLCHRLVYLRNDFSKQFVQIVLHRKRSFEILAVVNISYSYGFWSENIRFEIFKKLLILKNSGVDLHYMNTKTCKFQFFM